MDQSKFFSVSGVKIIKTKKGTGELTMTVKLSTDYYVTVPRVVKAKLCDLNNVVMLDPKVALEIEASEPEIDVETHKMTLAVTVSAHHAAAIATDATQASAYAMEWKLFEDFCASMLMCLACGNLVEVLLQWDHDLIVEEEATTEPEHDVE